MTNEEAIKMLKEDGCGYCTWQSTNPYECENEECKLKEALEMAIKALSQEPCDDAISRDMALEKMADYVASGYADSAEDFEEYSRIICQLPSVTQKSGKWIKKEDDTCWWYACSECEQEPLKNRWNDDDVLSTFCPNCGAKMESEVNNG